MRPRFRATCNNNQSTSRSLIRAIWSPFRASFHTLDFAETMGPSAMLPSSAFSSGFDLRLQGLYLRVSGSGRPSGPALLRRNNQYFIYYLEYSYKHTRELEFNAYAYYMNNPDLQTAIGPNPNALFQHFLTCGRAEGRTCESELEFK
jgi:hypothetical protein